MEALGAGLALRPEAPRGYSVRGLASMQQKRYREAEHDLDRALQLSPDSRPARLNRGVVAWYQKKTDAALADFEAVLQPPRENRLVEAAYYRGQLYLQLGEVAKALEDFDDLIAERTGFRPVYLLHARIRISQGETDLGLADLDANLADGRQPHPPGWLTHGRRGRLLRLMHAELPLEQRRKPAGQALLKLALSELTRAASSGGQAAQIYDDLGAVLELSGQRGKALADMAAAAQADPENAEAHSGAGYLRSLAQSPTEAQREAELALLHGGDNYLVLHNVACIYATLAPPNDRQAPANQEVAIALLRRAIALWKRAEASPSESDLIKGEPAFQSLRGREDFQQLIK